MSDALTSNASTGPSRGGALHVFEVLREEIISLRLAPRTVLSRAELQKRFGLSSTPIRDALLRLQEERLVAIFPQHATLVSPIDLGRAREAQFLRRSIELEIVRVLALVHRPKRRLQPEFEKIDSEQGANAQRRDRSEGVSALGPQPALLGKLRSLVRQQTAFAQLGELEAFNAADQAFHRALYEAAEVDGLWSLVRRHSGHIDRLRRLNLPVAGKMQEVIRDHEAIAAAIEAGQPDEAQHVLRDHLSRSLDFVESLRASHPDYFHAE
jgi:GntR family transcriptional regulator, rspAB operon transcriptional repressor